MNELIVPPAPLWYRSSVMACSPDNTLVYGCNNDLVVVRERNTEEPAEVKILQGAHSKHITSVGLNKKWKQPNSYVVSLGEDSIVKVWDIETFEKKFSNKVHTEHKAPVVGAVFAGDDRVVSAAQTGLVIVWNINTGEFNPLKSLFIGKVTLTCVSACPHAGWLLAFGLNNGCVIVADVRRDGQVLYRLRGHYQAVQSLSWCPAPVNVFPRYTQNTVKNKTEEITETVSQIQDAAVTSVDKKLNPWVNLVHADDDIPCETETEDPLQNTVNDFLNECDNLKNKILGLDASVSNGHVNDETEQINKTTPQYEEKGIEETEGSEYVQKLDKDRPLPRLFDPSGDFLDDSVDFNVTEEEILEDKDVGDEKNVDKTSSEDLSEDKDVTNEGDVKDGGGKSVGQDGDGQIDVDEDKDLITSEGDIKDGGDKSSEKSVGQDGDGQIDVDEDKDLITGEGDVKDQTLTDDKNVGQDGDGIAKSVKVPIEEEPRLEYLLASVGKDCSVYIWRAGTDGRMQTFFQMPKKGKGKKDSKNPNTWNTICWPTPDTLLTSSLNGEILVWTLPKPKESNKQYKVVHFEHSPSTVFNIVTPPVYSTVYNWRDKRNVMIWSSSQDGRLINFELNTQKINISYTAVPTSVTCFDSSPLDPNRLAIGHRDGAIRVWDLSLPHSRIITMQKYQQKFSHKVSTLAWNPIKEMMLAFGTEEGRVGFIDLTAKKTELFPPYFHSQVYKVEWGPIRGTKDLGIYVVAEGIVAIYNTKVLNKDPVLLQLPNQTCIYRFAWKPDGSLLLLNGKDGSVMILTSDLVATTTVYLSDKGFNEIVWHPDALLNKSDVTKRCNWFAAATAKGLLVYDCVLFKETCTSENIREKIVAAFEGHVKPVTSLAWCPFDGNRIVSTGGDGLAHVWDVVAKTAIATFVNPYSYYSTAVEWSPIDPDLIIIGGKIITVWSISKNPPKIDEEFLASRKRLLNKVPKSEPDKVDKQQSNIKVDIPQVKTSAKISLVPPICVYNDDNFDLQVDQMRKLFADKEDTNDKNLLNPLHVFGDKEQVSQLLTANYEFQKKQNRHKSCELISLWKGNLGEDIEAAINENRVTLTTIALAPMVSLKLWQDSCEVYAKKLSESAESDPLETAMFFLACHKVEEAINCLCVNTMFKEALALAKHRLPSNSEIITQVTEKWAQYCINTGNFETAAFCYISVEQYANAAKVLSRRNRRQFLELAAELAEKDGNKELYQSIMSKLSEIQTDVDVSNTCQKDEESLPSRIDVVVNEKKGCDTQESDFGTEMERQFEEPLPNTEQEEVSPSVEKDVKDSNECERK